MIIPIDDKYRIKSSVESWDIQRFEQGKKGVGLWKSIKYFHSLSAALSGLFELKVRASDAEGLDECIKEANRIFEGMTTALNRGDYLLYNRSQEGL